MDIDYTSNNNYIYACWEGFYDEEVPIVSYEWCVGTSEGSDDIVGCHDVGLTGCSVTNDGAPYPTG